MLPALPWSVGVKPVGPPKRARTDDKIPVSAGDYQPACDLDTGTAEVWARAATVHSLPTVRYQPGARPVLTSWHTVLHLIIARIALNLIILLKL
jgi:hypothetical protein